MSTKYNWDLIKTDYITGNIPYRKISEKYGVAMATLAKRAKKEKWTELKKKHNKKVIEKALQKSATSKAKALAKNIVIAEALMQTIEKATADIDQFNRHIVSEGTGQGYSETSEQVFAKIDMKAVKDATKALQIITRVQKEIYGIDAVMDKKTQEEIEISREKLKLDQAKAEKDMNKDKEIKITITDEVQKWSE